MSLATRDHFGTALHELGAKYPQVVVFNCDLGLATRTLAFKSAFPERFIDCGIAEANAISVAAGMAQESFRPLVCSFGHFLTAKFLEIFQSVGLNNTPVILVGTHAGMAIGKDGPTQMGLRDLGLMRLVPNVEILHPSDGIETRAGLEYAFSHSRPTYLRLCRQPGPEFHSSSYTFRFGALDVLHKGENLLLVGQGGSLISCAAAVQELQHEGKNPGLVNISSLPFCDDEFAALVQSYQKLMIVDDHYVRGGIADDIFRVLASRSLTKKIVHLAVSDFAQAAAPEELYERYGLDAAAVAEQARKIWFLQ